MARVTHVKRAQRRYATKPVLDAQGQPIKIALTGKDGTPKTTSAKRGSRPIFITKTVRDTTRPLPNYTCDKCGAEIEPGQPYKWIKPKSGPYGGHMRTRCGSCPTWQVWDYSYSLSAQIARIEHDATEAVYTAESTDDVESILNDAAEQIRELAEQKREGASNIEEGFGHATYQSEELEQQAEDLDSWADDVEGTDVPEPEMTEDECPACDGTGEVSDTCSNCDGDGEVHDETCETCNGDGEVFETCDECGGTGTQEGDPENLSDDDLENAREAWSEAVSEALANCPV